MLKNVIKTYCVFLYFRDHYHFKKMNDTPIPCFGNWKYDSEIFIPKTYYCKHVSVMTKR